MTAVPDRTIAIGDIHGCSLALRALLDASRPDPDDFLVFLGDFIDRGPDIRQARGRGNRLPRQAEREVLRMWAAREGLHVAEYL
jgi:hypothetical protein